MNKNKLCVTQAVPLKNGIFHYALYNTKYCNAFIWYIRIKVNKFSIKTNICVCVCLVIALTLMSAKKQPL
jgi:hypothetical protein